MSPNNLTQRKTLAPENQLKINCPVFPAQVRIASCFELRDLVWRGEKPEVRRGCQAAMRADKCPINNILKRIGRQDCDPYHSNEPKVVSLDSEDLKKIAPVLVLDMHMTEARVPTNERELLEAGNERAREGGKLLRASQPRKQKAAPQAVVEAAPEAPLAPSAATTGDMSAAINAELKAQE